MADEKENRPGALCRFKKPATVVSLHLGQLIGRASTVEEAKTIGEKTRTGLYPDWSVGIRASVEKGKLCQKQKFFSLLPILGLGWPVGQWGKEKETVGITSPKKK